MNTLGRLLLVAVGVGLSGPAFAGAFVFAGETFGVDLIAHPKGYTGTQSVVTVEVCLRPTSDVTPSTYVKSVQNIIEIWNQMQPKVGTVRLGSANDLAFLDYDFESVALHELGHCIGLAHVNAASESGLPDDDQDYTKATDGPNNSFDLDDGIDNVRGTLDDIRGDDVNLHWFRVDTNDPGQLPLPAVVDGTTFDYNLASLPGVHSFAQNLDRDAAGVMGHPNTSTIKTESVMQQGTFNDEVQRELTPDDVATVLMAMSGIDETAGNTDDYVINLTYGGISSASSCDINLSFDATETGFAVCKLSASIGGGHVSISSANIYFNDNPVDFVYNTDGPCRQKLDLVQDQWKQIALSCDPGSNNTVTQLLDDDLGVLDTHWAIYERDAANEVYVRLTGSSTMSVGRGYWIKTLQANQTIEIEEDFNASNVIPLVSHPTGRLNMVGHAYWYDYDWADVRIIDPGNPSSPLTLDEADPDTDNDNITDCDEAPLGPNCIMSRKAYRYNGASYASFTGTIANPGTLENFDSIWVKAYKSGISLEFPDKRSTAAAPHGRNAAAFANDRGRTQQPAGWSVRLTASSGNLVDPDNALGRWSGANIDFDSNDLDEPEPFGSPYLTVVFPRPNWGVYSGDYNTDYRPHPATRRNETWEFEVRGSEPMPVTLSWDGDDEILRNAVLIDIDNDREWYPFNGDYRFKLVGETHRFRWVQR